MRISDWSSDVCSSDLQAAAPAAEPEGPAPEASPESSYAIPAAPENDGSATAFLLNHQPTIYGEENTDARIVLRDSQDARSEERRVGKEGVSTCRSRWSSEQSKKKKCKNE